MQATGERKPAKKAARTGATVSVLFINRDGADHMRDLDAEGDMFPNVGMVAPAGRHGKAGAVEVASREIGSARPDPEERRCVGSESENPSVCNALSRR